MWIKYHLQGKESLIYMSKSLDVFSPDTHHQEASVVVDRVTTIYRGTEEDCQQLVSYLWAALSKKSDPMVDVGVWASFRKGRTYKELAKREVVT